MKALRRAAFTWKFRTHLAKRAFRPVSFSFRETRLHGCVYKGPTLRTNYARPRWLRFSGNYTLVPYAAFFFIPSLYPFTFPTPACGPFRSQYLFCLDRSSLIPHSDSRYTVTGDHFDTSRGRAWESGSMNLGTLQRRTMCA